MKLPVPIIVYIENNKHQRQSFGSWNELKF